MSMLGALLLAFASGLVLVVLVPVIAFRMAVAFLSQERVGWVQSLAAVVLAGFAQGCATGLFGGMDAGLFGAIVGWVAWSAVASVVAGIPFGRAFLVGIVMAVISWLMWWVLLVWLLFTGAAFLLGLAGAAALA